MQPVVAIVVAAGSGSRLGGDIPKALREVDGTPLVALSLAALAAGGVSAAVIVVPRHGMSDFESVLAEMPIPVGCVAGGAERQDSVLAGLDAIADDAELSSARFVLVHDAARALVPPEVVARVIAALEAGSVACVPVVPVVDTIRQLTANDSVVVDRTQLRAVQTPQGFDRNLLHRGHRLVRQGGRHVTDDAAVIELLGERITLVEGSREAFKVTEPLDLVFAEALARSRR